jgi:hypothetical protein
MPLGWFTTAPKSAITFAELKSASPSTLKLFTASVGLRWVGMNMQTLVASLTSVPRMHQYYNNSFSQSFVGDKCS